VERGKILAIRGSKAEVIITDLALFSEQEVEGNYR
jgi:hypothetical protein